MSKPAHSIRVRQGRTSFIVAAAAALAGTAMPAQAATFIFSSGTYQSGVTSPNPLLAPDVLSIESTAAKSFGTGTFTNQSGTVNWSGGTIFLVGGAAAINNNNVWNATSNDSITIANGGGIFTNTGLFQKTAGTGVTQLNAVNFINAGTIQAQTGTIQFLGGGNTVFNAGSAFTGAGTVSVATNATFNGSFNSANLDFSSGTFTGNNASLNGTADFLSGNFTGGWNVASGATLNLVGTTAKTFGGGTFDNDGTLAWNGGTIFLTGGAAALVNDGTMTATTNDSITIANGGGSFTNNGTFVKTGGTGITTLVDSSLANNGLMDVRSGTIGLPTNFANNGTLAGTGTFALSGTLTNNGTIAPGALGTGIGTLSLTGNYAQGAGGLFSVGFGPGGTADLLNISGTAALNGTLALNCLGCAFNAGDLFTILDSVGDLSGVFANTTATGFNSGFAYSVLYDTALDRVRVRIDNAGTPTPPVGGAVPEPATWAMLLFGFGAVGSMLRRRRGPAVRIRYA